MRLCLILTQPQKDEMIYSEKPNKTADKTAHDLQEPFFIFIFVVLNKEKETEKVCTSF